MVRYFTSSPKFFKVTAFVILMLMMTGTAILYLSNFKWATVYVNGETYRCVTLAESVEEVLEEIGLELREEDYVYPPRENKLKRMAAIAVVHAQPYVINHDGMRTEIWSVGPKVADVLLGAGLSWQEQDIITPPVESTAAGSEITLVRVSSEHIQEAVTLPYAVIRVANDSLYRGQERLVQSGINGRQVNNIKAVYHDNQLVERKVISSELVVAAQDKIVEYGTISSISRGGLKIGISRVLDVQSTAYCSGVEGTGCPVDARGYSQCTGKATGYTATGRKAKAGDGSRNNPYIIAVDPKVIPLGTLCYLSFKGGGVTTRHGRIITDGFALAADTGSAIKGNRIDILFDNHWVAWYYGRRKVRVFIVESVTAE
ncbi:MAG: G5 domain-containing protein [Bacillota bacterium]|jgi:uncharacterized protein YabE (DUF348 family)/3D (Asp-Asp-Asp) domain-containing protein|nr:DUF348 domain-containing protein [Bacillota bacterium]